MIRAAPERPPYGAGHAIAISTWPRLTTVYRRPLSTAIKINYCMNQVSTGNQLKMYWRAGQGQKNELHLDSEEIRKRASRCALLHFSVVTSNVSKSRNSGSINMLIKFNLTVA